MAASKGARVVLALLCAVWLLPRAARAAEEVVLVPGTLNSALPGTLRTPYFSAAVLEAVSDAGYESFVIQGLRPIGGLEENGAIALKGLREEYLRRHPAKDVPITLLCHSAGGLFALYAAANAPDLPIRRIIMVSTPLEGARLADYFLGDRRKGEELRRELSALPLPINLDGLKELAPKGVAEFLSKLRLNPEIKLYTASGSQSSPPGPLSTMDVEYLSPVFTVTNRIIGERSDGIVECRSAYGRGAIVPGTDGRPVPIRSLEGLHADLDHAEQLLDWRLLESLGFYNAFRIGARQKAFYASLLNAAR
jgi:pimeloyl-ACP methyl ester carboxylesterase